MNSMISSKARAYYWVAVMFWIIAVAVLFFCIFSVGGAESEMTGVTIAVILIVLGGVSYSLGNKANRVILSLARRARLMRVLAIICWVLIFFLIMKCGTTPRTAPSSDSVDATFAFMMISIIFGPVILAYAIVFTIAAVGAGKKKDANKDACRPNKQASENKKRNKEYTDDSF